MPAVRRTQAERREATIGKLVEATIGCLAELGYSGTSTGAICKRAGVSQGGMFRHFGTRLELIAAAAALQIVPTAIADKQIAPAVPDQRVAPAAAAQGIAAAAALQKIGACVA